MLLVPHLAEPARCLQDELSFMLVDRHPLFLAALAELIRGACPQASIDVTTDSRRALLMAYERPMDLLFCEPRAMPLSGADLATRIEAGNLRTRVVLIGDAEDHDLLLSELGCGAAGFFTKDAAPEVFLQGLEAVLAGHLVLGRELLRPTVERLELKDGTDNRRLEQLSEAERGILVLVGQAQSTRAIAASRGLSEKTVRNHLASIYRKLRIRNRSQAVLWSARVERGADSLSSQN
jgi:DNA-binding NarL/FixJ family response regulator